MKIFLFILFLTFPTISIHSQDSKVYKLSEVTDPPMFYEPSVYNKLYSKKDAFVKNVYSFIQKNINIITNRTSTQHKAFVEVLIDENGNTTITNSRGSSKIAEKEALKAVKKLPKLIPAKLDNKSVKMTFIIPVKFNVYVIN